MTKPTYWELLRDPRWQRKRLEIMERDDFKCRECGDGTTTLNVHHSYYAKSHKPWEYEDDSLRTLCEPCHELITGVTAELQRLIGRLPSYHVDRVLGYVRALVVDEQWPAPWERATAATPRLTLSSYEQVIGAAMALNCSPDELCEVQTLDGSVGLEEVNTIYVNRHKKRTAEAVDQAIKQVIGNE